MKTKDVIDFFGGKAETQFALRISHTTLNNWIASGQVPNESQPKIQIISCNALKWDMPAGMKLYLEKGVMANPKPLKFNDSRRK